MFDIVVVDDVVVVVVVVVKLLLMLLLLLFFLVHDPELSKCLHEGGNPLRAPLSRKG